MPPQKGQISKATLIERLQNVPSDTRLPDDVLQCLKINDLIAEAKKHNLVSDGEVKASTCCREHTVKMFLWSLVHDSDQRKVIREYAVVCSQLYLFALMLLNLCWFQAKKSQDTDPGAVESFLKLVLQSLGAGNGGLGDDLFLQIINPQRVVDSKRNYVLLPIVKDTLDANPSLMSMMPEWKQLAGGKLLMWDNAVKYISNKMAGCIKNHVLVHIVSRIKQVLRKSCIDVDRSLEAFIDGKDMSEELPLSDWMQIVQLRRKLGTDDGKTVEQPEKITMELLRLHFELAEELQTFSPFPVSTLSRTYHIIDDRICQALTGKDLTEVFGLTKSVWKARLSKARKAKRKRKAKKSRKNAKGKKVRVSSGRSYVLKETDTVRTVDTDGYGLGIHVRTPIIHCYEDVLLDMTDAKSRAKELRKKKLKVMTDLPSPKAKLGNDPGGVNLYFMALKDGEGQFQKIRYSRATWRRDIRLEERVQWNNVRAQQDGVQSALAALAENGYRNANADKWAGYANAVIANWSVLKHEFVENDSRCSMRMKGFRLGQKALMKAADRVLDFASTRTTNDASVLIGYGDGNVGLGAKGTPVQSMYQALVAAFKRHRRAGGVIKVSEYNTTQKCHRCGERMEKVYGVIDGRWQEDRDFRCCTSCQDKQRKLRNRDFNAAINILKVFEAELEGAERPEYLWKQASGCKRRANAAKTAPKKRSSALRPKST
jgi:hypothetical protein